MTGDPPPRRGLLGRVRRLGWHTIVPLAALLAGLLFATSAHVSQGRDLRSTDTTDLADVIRDVDRTVERRAQGVADLQGEIDDLTAKAAPGNLRLQQLTRAAGPLSVTVGVEAVDGPSLTVSLDDAHRTSASLPEGFTADDIVVHQQDVQSVVNAMWAGGAEAMMLQDQRVISTSAVRCVGNTLILQGRVYSPPYVISAIGDVQGMRQALESDPQVVIYRQYADLLGLGWEVKQHSALHLPAFDGALSLRYATVPDTGPAGSPSSSSTRSTSGTRGGTP